MDYTSMCT